MRESQTIREIGISIDRFCDSEAETRALIQGAEKMASALTEARDKTLFAYFMSNAWANLYNLRVVNTGKAWAWEQPELQQQICLLRTALISSGFNDLDRIPRCQIYTNLGNALNTVGRVGEALEHWDRAIMLIPKFGMALGNRALGLETYARGQYDPGHAWILWLNAVDAYEAALASDVYFDSPGKDQIAQCRARAAAIAPTDAVRQSYAPDGHSLGRSQVERAYRAWALQHRLFLHPLNELGPISLAARDVLSQPSFVAPVNEPPMLVGFFNQLKQEYVSARWLVYSGISAEHPHFSDRDVLLQDTLDYPAYCLGVEQIKAGYRLAYSLFDKVAFFINRYWQLGCPERKISFRAIWFHHQQPDMGLHQTFVDAQNLLLRGLYWIAKDLFVPSMRDTTEPAARDLAAIRNHLEHKYLKVTDAPYEFGCSVGPFGKDTLAHVISRNDLEEKTFKILKLARAALIHLVLAMHTEELRRNHSGDGFVPMVLPTVPQRFKRRR